MAIVARCPHCGHVGTDAMPHRVYDRWASAASAALAVRDEAAQLVADGYDPERTSVTWFDCAGCGNGFPAWWWRAGTAQVHVNLAHEDGRAWDPLELPAGVRPAPPASLDSAAKS